MNLKAKRKIMKFRINHFFKVTKLNLLLKLDQMLFAEKEHKSQKESLELMNFSTN